MSDLRFYGASDDLVEVEGVFTEEYPGDDITFLVESDDGQGSVEGCHVRVRYTQQGTWAVELAKIEEGFPIPWPVRIEDPPFAAGYSLALVLDVPDDVRVERLTGEGGR